MNITIYQLKRHDFLDKMSSTTTSPQKEEFVVNIKQHTSSIYHLFYGKRRSAQAYIPREVMERLGNPAAVKFVYTDGGRVEIRPSEPQPYE